MSNCLDCKFYVGSAPREGECHLEPPQLSPIIREKYYDGPDGDGTRFRSYFDFPHVMSEDFCGQHEEATPLKPAPSIARVADPTPSNVADPAPKAKEDEPPKPTIANPPAQI